MSILILLLTFVRSSFKSQRQFELENLALRQQVTTLRQSVKHSSSSTAPPGIKAPNNPPHSTTRRQASIPRPSTTSSASTTPGSSGVTRVSTPGYTPNLFRAQQRYPCPNSEGVSYRLGLGKADVAVMGTPTGPRVACFGSGWHGALPHPCPGYFAWHCGSTQ